MIEKEGPNGHDQYSADGRQAQQAPKHHPLPLAPVGHGQLFQGAGLGMAVYGQPDQAGKKTDPRVEEHDVTPVLIQQGHGNAIGQGQGGDPAQCRPRNVDAHCHAAVGTFKRQADQFGRTDGNQGTADTE